MIASGINLIIKILLDILLRVTPKEYWDTLDGHFTEYKEWRERWEAYKDEPK